MKLLLLAIVISAMPEPAAAHHVIGGMTPVTLAQGLLSGLGHPIIGLDHFAAIVAVGCLAAWQRHGPLLIVAYVIAMTVGVACHLHGPSVAGTEILVALSVLALGAALWWPVLSVAALAMLFVAGGLINGYALGESIAGAEPAPLYAYFIGLAVTQIAVALVALAIVRALERRQLAMRVHLFGAVVVGIGLAAFAKDLLGV